MNVGGRLRLQSRGGERCSHRLHAFAGAVVELGDSDVVIAAVVQDVPGPPDEGDDAAEAADHVLRPQALDELRRGIDAVLERYDARVGANEGTNQRGDFGHLPRLDRHEDSVDGADVARRVRCLGVRDCEVSLDAAYQKAVSADGLEVGAPRDERHVLAGAGQAAAEVAADSSGPVYSKSHDG